MQEDIINALGTASFAACYCKKFFRSYWKQTLLFSGFALTPSQRKIWQANQGGEGENDHMDYL